MLNNVRPIFKKLLLIAIALYVIGVSVMQVDMYLKIGKIHNSLISHSIEE